jgi:hypothetical protein
MRRLLVFGLVVGCAFLVPPASAANPSLEYCGIVSGLTSQQLDFAASVALLSDARREQVLGTDDDMRGVIQRCAAQVREQICTAKSILAFLNPQQKILSPESNAAAAGKGVVAGAATGYFFGGNLGLFSLGGGTIFTLVSGAAALKRCVERREALAVAADRLQFEPIDPGATLVSYEMFVDTLRRNVDRQVSMADANQLAAVADETRRALAQAVR